MDWGECGLGRCAIVGRIPYWGCKSNLCGADLEGGGASNLTGADRGRMWIGAVSPASVSSETQNPRDVRCAGWRAAEFANCDETEQDQISIDNSK